MRNFVRGLRRHFVAFGVRPSSGAARLEWAKNRKASGAAVLTPSRRPGRPHSEGVVATSRRKTLHAGLAVPFATILALTAFQPGSEAAIRPQPAKGSHSRTLIVHTAARSPYTLGHELEFLKLQLRRVETQLEAIPASEATSNQIAGADYLVLFSPTPGAVVPAGLLESLVITNKPLLWAGFGSEQLAQRPPLSGQFASLPAAEPNLKQVAYRGRDWDAGGAYCQPMRLLPNSKAEPILTIPAEDQGLRLAIGWRHKQVTVFSAVPDVGPLQPLFADVLLDFFGIKDVAGPRLLLRIDDYQAASNHREFKRMVDFLFSRGHAFALPVTPSWRNAETKAIEDLESAPEFVAGLRYAQQRGGRIVLRGGVRETNDHAEFWDTESDRPPAGEQRSMVRDMIGRATALLLKHGLLPLAWQTPHDSASRLAYAEFANTFSTCVERPQLSDATRLGQGLASTITVDQYGRILLPENVGYLSGDSPEAVADLTRRAQALTQLRGTVAGCRFHAYLGFEKLTELVTALDQLKAPFLDLADLDHWVHVQGRLLLSGRAQRTVAIGDAPFVRKTYDRSGRMLSSLSGKVAAGNYTFQREGGGDYELLEFTGTKP